MCSIARGYSSAAERFRYVDVETPADDANGQIVGFGVIRDDGDGAIPLVPENRALASLLIGHTVVLAKVAEKLSTLHAFKV